MAQQRRFFARIWRRGRTRRTGRQRRPRTRSARARSKRASRALISDVLQRHDTMTQRAEVGAIADAYLTLDDTGRERFFRLLATRFLDRSRSGTGVDPSGLRAATTPLQRRAAEHDLRDALTPPAGRLLRLFTGARRRREAARRPARRPAALRRRRPGARARSTSSSTSTWSRCSMSACSRCSRITWDSPASLLEKLIAYEAVHAIDSWTDLKNRLDSDRRCYAFFHPAMPAEPLVFVEVALTSGIATDLVKLLDETRARSRPRTGRYRGVLFDLELPARSDRREPRQRARSRRSSNSSTSTCRTCSGSSRCRRSPASGAGWSPSSPARSCRTRERALLPAEPARVLARLADEDWGADEAIKPALLALCARYLTSLADGRVRDQVANFHYANGAALEQIDWLADPSPSGRDRSAGLMSNYLYEPDRIAGRARAVRARGRSRVFRRDTRSARRVGSGRGEARLPHLGPAVARSGRPPEAVHRGPRPAHHRGRRAWARSARRRRRRPGADDDQGPRRRTARARVRVGLARRARLPHLRRGDPRGSRDPARADTSSPSRSTATTATTSTRRRVRGRTANDRRAS